MKIKTTKTNKLTNLAKRNNSHLEKKSSPPKVKRLNQLNQSVKNLVQETRKGKATESSEPDKSSKSLIHDTKEEEEMILPNKASPLSSEWQKIFNLDRRKEESNESPKGSSGSSKSNKSNKTNTERKLQSKPAKNGDNSNRTLRVKSFAKDSSEGKENSNESDVTRIHIISSNGGTEIARSVERNVKKVVNTASKRKPRTKATKRRGNVNVTPSKRILAKTRRQEEKPVEILNNPLKVMSSNDEFNVNETIDTSCNGIATEITNEQTQEYETVHLKIDPKIDDSPEKLKDDTYDSDISQESIEILDSTQKHDNITVSALDVKKPRIRNPPYCKICSKMFTSYRKLMAHRKEHEGDKPYKCLHCSQMYTNLEDLTAHLRLHQGKLPYKCKKCYMEFNTEKEREEHEPLHTLRKAAKVEKHFECELCFKRFRKISEVDRHMRVHTGEKPVACNICNKRFQQTHNLTKHLLIHIQAKPFECEICNKKFGRVDVLNRHFLTHSLVKPYNCPHCSKSFIRPVQLTAHIAKNHATN